jgi:NADH-quinone oxidoreductase subunit F
MEGICQKLEAGHGTAEDVAKLEQVANSIAGNTICALGDAAAMPVQSFVKKFKPEFLAHVELRRCPCGDHGWGLTQAPQDAVAGPVRYAR